VAQRKQRNLRSVNFPHSPTGALPDRATFDALVDICARKGLHLFSDEVCRFMEMNEADHLPGAVGIYPSAVSLGVMSKSFGLAGLRIGWLALHDRALRRKIWSFKDYLTICNSGPSEILALMALRARKKILDRNRQIVGQNLVHLDRFFADWAGVFEWVRPRGRTPERAEQFARDVETRFAVRVTLAECVGDAVRGSDIVVTVTPSRKPIVQAEWISPGMHITAVGSDGPDKQELAADVLANADKIVADSREQCIKLGELHHACSLDRFHAELGEIAAGAKPGRESEDEITVADLTGVGIQDAAVANCVFSEAVNQNIGRWLET
jgi:hypothetical protein